MCVCVLVAEGRLKPPNPNPLNPLFFIDEQRATPITDTHQWGSNNLSLLNRVPCLPAYQPGLCANVVYAPTCLRANVVYVPTWQKRVNFSFLCSNVSYGLPFFFILACQRANKGAKFFRHFCYQVLRKISILYYYIKKSTFYAISVIHIICICIVNKNCIIIYLYTACHIKEKCVEFFFFYSFIFCALVIN